MGQEGSNMIDLTGTPNTTTKDNIFDGIKRALANEKVKRSISIIFWIALLVILVISLVVNTIRVSKKAKTSTSTSVITTTDIPVIVRDSDSDKRAKETEATNVMPSGTVIFGEDSFETYSTQSAALAHVIGLPSSMTSCYITGVPGENTVRMRVVVDYVAGGQLPQIEEFLYSANNWSALLDLEGLSGKTIVLMIASESNDLIPKISYEYVAFEIPSTN
jgi:hypothetical protein